MGSFYGNAGAATSAGEGTAYDDTLVKQDISNNKTTIEAEVARATAAQDAINGKIDTLNGDNTVEGSVKKIITDEVTKIIANAPEDFDTLKQVADYIAADKTRADELETTISGLQRTVGEINGSYITKATLGSVIDSIQSNWGSEIGSIQSNVQPRLASLENFVNSADTTYVTNGVYFQGIAAIKDAENRDHQSLSDAINQAYEAASFAKSEAHSNTLSISNIQNRTRELQKSSESSERKLSSLEQSYYGNDNNLYVDPTDFKITIPDESNPTEKSFLTPLTLKSPLVPNTTYTFLLSMDFGTGRELDSKNTNNISASLFYVNSSGQEVNLTESRPLKDYRITQVEFSDSGFSPIYKIVFKTPIDIGGNVTKCGMYFIFSDFNEHIRVEDCYWCYLAEGELSQDFFDIDGTKYLSRENSRKIKKLESATSSKADANAVNMAFYSNPERLMFTYTSDKTEHNDSEYNFTLPYQTLKSNTPYTVTIFSFNELTANYIHVLAYSNGNGQPQEMVVAEADGFKELEYMVDDYDFSSSDTRYIYKIHFTTGDVPDAYNNKFRIVIASGGSQITSSQKILIEEGVSGTYVAGGYQSLGVVKLTGDNYMRIQQLEKEVAELKEQLKAVLSAV